MTEKTRAPSIELNVGNVDQLSKHRWCTMLSGPRRHERVADTTIAHDPGDRKVWEGL